MVNFWQQISNVASVNLPTPHVHETIETISPSRVYQEITDLKFRVGDFVPPDSNLLVAYYKSRPLTPSENIEIVNYYNRLVSDADGRSIERIDNQVRAISSQVEAVGKTFVATSERWVRYLGELEVVEDSYLFYKHETQFYHSERNIGSQLVTLTDKNYPQQIGQTYYVGNQIRVIDRSGLVPSIKYNVVVEETAVDDAYSVIIYCESNASDLQIVYNKTVLDQTDTYVSEFSGGWKEHYVPLSALERGSDASSQPFWWDGELLFNNSGGTIYIRHSETKEIDVVIPPRLTTKDPWSVNVSYGVLRMPITSSSSFYVYNETDGTWVAINDRVSFAHDLLASTHTPGQKVLTPLEGDDANYYYVLEYEIGPVTAPPTEGDSNVVTVTNEIATIVPPSAFSVSNSNLVGLDQIVVWVPVSGAYVDDDYESGGSKLTIANGGISKIDASRGIIYISDSSVVNDNVGELIYVDYSYYQAYKTYGGYTDDREISVWQNLYPTWRLDLNPTVGHSSVLYLEREPFVYRQETGGTVWETDARNILGTPEIYVDGTLTASGWSLNTETGILTFNTGLATDARVEGTFIADSPSSKFLKKSVFLYLDPTRVFRVPSTIDDLLALTPSMDVTGKMEPAIKHTLEPGYFDPDSPLYDPAKLLLARLNVIPNSGISNIQVLDVRRRGGGLDKQDHVWDISSMEGQTFWNNVLVITMPREISAKLGSGELSMADVKKAVERWIAAGTVYVLKFEDGTMVYPGATI